MKLNHRQARILEWVRREEHVQVEALAATFKLTPQTIRRDITPLCEAGLLRRRYGGVSLPSSSVNLSFSSRQVMNAPAKRAIAKALAERLPDDASVHLGIGTTMEFVARALMGRPCKVLTNNLKVASVLCDSDNTEVIVSGGHLRHNDDDVVGAATTTFFADFCADYGVIGCGSLDPNRGAMDFDLREADVSRAIIANARRRVLIADHSKWERQALARVVDFDQIDLFITDQLSNDARHRLPSTLEIIETEAQLTA